MDDEELYDRIQSDTVERIMQAMLLLGAGGLVASLLRYFDFGWMPVMTMHLAAYGIFVVVYFLRNRLAYELVASLVVTIFLLVALSGYVALGKASGGNFYSLCGAVLATVLLGRRAGFFVLGLIALWQLITGIAFSQNIWSADLNLNEYNASSMAWLTNTASLLITALMIVVLLKQKTITVSVLAQLQEKKREAEQNDRAKSRFVSTMSHELRTPLNGIIGLSNMLKETELDKTQQEYVDLLASSSQHMVELIGNTLDMMKIEAGSLSVQNEPLRLEPDMKSLVDSLRYVAEANGTALTLHHGLSEAVALEGDRTKVRQIVYNLLSNAIKFTRDGVVELSIMEASAEAACHVPGGMTVHIAVKDSGDGIPKDQMDLLFKPFAQAENTRAVSALGTGLGLAITKQLVELMGGTIGVRSTLNEGTTFDVFLPFAQGHQEERTEAESTERPSLRILVAEDNAVSSLVLGATVERLGHSVLHAANGKQAVEYALNPDLHVDLILMDVDMPILDGVDATRQIRLEKSAEVLPIIGATATLSEKRDTYVEAGMNNVLIKPLNEVDLRELLAAFSAAK